VFVGGGTAGNVDGEPVAQVGVELGLESAVVAETEPTEALGWPQARSTTMAEMATKTPDAGMQCPVAAGSVFVFTQF